MQSRSITRGCARAIVCALVVASCGGKGTAESTVGTVKVTPETATIDVTATVQLSATAKDTAGNSATCAFNWTTSAANVARVSENGLVTGVGAGVATIKAGCQGQSGQAVVTVVAPTGGGQLVPAALDFATHFVFAQSGGGWDISLTSHLSFSSTPQTAADGNSYYVGQAPLTHGSAVFTLPNNPGCTVTSSSGTDGVLKAYVPAQSASVESLRLIVNFAPVPMETATIHCEQPPYPPYDQTIGPSGFWFAEWVVNHGPPTGPLGWEITGWRSTAPSRLMRTFDQSGTVTEHTDLTLTLVQSP